jgi:hypothetical protein
VSLLPIVSIIEFLAGFFGIGLLMLSSLQVSVSTPARPDNSLVWIIILGILYLLLLPAAFKRWQVLLTEQNYHPLMRVIFALGLIGILAAVFSLPVIYNLGNTITFSKLLKFYVSNFLLTLFLLVLLLPSIIFFYTNIIDAVIWILWIFVSGIFAFVFFHSPFTVKQVRKLVLDGAKSSDGKLWKLVDVPDIELGTLKKLAESNRDGTDKRLVPITLFLGLLQVLGWEFLTKFLGIDSLWNGMLQALIMRDNFMIILTSAAFGFMLSLLFLSTFARLISNLLAQGIIIEACILVQYGREKQLAQQSIEIKASRKGFWARLGDFLDRFNQ